MLFTLGILGRFVSGRKARDPRQLEMALEPRSLVPPAVPADVGADAGARTDNVDHSMPANGVDRLHSGRNGRSGRQPLADRATSDPADQASELLGRLRLLGLRGISHLSLTRNASTVASFRGDRLRVHREFVAAPPDMLQAVVDFVNGRGHVRQRARRKLVTFTATEPVRSQRRPAPHPDDARHAAKLQEAHRQLNQSHFGGALAPIPVHVSRRMKTRLGHFSPNRATGTPEIAIGRRHIRRDGWESVIETLIHEMIHQWQHETGRPLAHDAAFRRKARELGISPRATRPAGRTDRVARDFVP